MRNEEGICGGNFHYDGARPYIELWTFYSETAGVFAVGKGAPSGETNKPLSEITPTEPGPPSAPDMEGAAAVNMDDVILRDHGEVYTLHTNCISAVASFNYEISYIHIDIIAIPLGLTCFYVS